jgi:hypothetical protein
MNGYAITDANKSVWVCQDNSGSYSLTTDKNRALIFGTKPAAETVFNSNLSKLIKSKGVAVKAITLQIAGADPQPQPKTEVSLDNTDSANYIVSVISEAVGKLNCRHTALVDQLSKYDRQRTDVEHYIELNAGKLNACDGFKAYKLLQDVLVERRKVKDELSIRQTVRSRITSPEELADIEVNELGSRHYEPREFTHLFETKEK